MRLIAKSGTHESYRNEDIKFYIDSYINTLEKVELTASTTILRGFQNKEYRFTIPKFQLAEKQGYRQLQSVLRFTQTH